jgi:hypothetical protein
MPGDADLIQKVVPLLEARPVTVFYGNRDRHKDLSTK